MIKVLLSLIGFWSFAAFAIQCDCDVTVYSPITGSHALPPRIIRTLELESFSTHSVKNQKRCRASCEKEFHKTLNTETINSYLYTYSRQLIDEKQLGFNCTGLTNLKFPVRVRARIDQFGLGNVVDMIYAINHEEICF